MITKKQLAILKQASKILHKDWDKYNCKDYNAFCSQCRAERIIKDYDCLVDFMDIDEK